MLNYADDGVTYDPPTLVEPEGWEHVGTVTWDHAGTTDTVVWRITAFPESWYYQDRDHGGEYGTLTHVDHANLREHLRMRRITSCDPLIRGLSLDTKIQQIR